MYKKLDFKPSLWQVAQGLIGRISASDVLSYYNADNVYQLGNEWVHSCLVERVESHHSHGDDKPSASMKSDASAWNCWSFGGGSLLWFISTMEQGNESQIRKVFHDLSQGLAQETSEQFLASLDRLWHTGTPQEDIPTYSKRLLAPWLQIRHPAWVDVRGISLDTVDRMQLGYDEKDIRLVIPHFWSGELVGWQKRSLTLPQYPMTPKNAHIKYLNSPAFPRKSTLYNFDSLNESEPVFVVESPMSVLRGISHGGQFSNVTATFGAGITQTQIELLKRFPKIYLGMDPDAAGETGTYRLLKGLMPYSDVRVLTFPKETDFADLSIDPQNSTNLYAVVAEAEYSWQAMPRLTQLMMDRKRSKNGANQARGRAE